MALDTGLLRRRRDFRLLLTGRTVSRLGTMITTVALPVQVYQLTGSSLDVGLIGVAQFVPMVALSLFGGALADAFDRRRLVQIAELSAALVSALLVINASLPHPQVWVLYIAAALGAAAAAVLGPPLSALLPRLVEKDELGAAFAIDWTLGNVASLAGPALGGVLVATAGAASAYGVDVASFGVSLVALTAMRAVPPPAEGDRPSLRGILDGLRYAGSRQELIGTYLVDFNAMLFGMPMALFPALAVHYGGNGIVGLLYAAPSAGSIIVSASSGWTKRVHRHGAAITLAAIGWGAAIVVFGFARSLVPALLCLIVAGGADAISGLFRAVVWNGTIPDSLRGRLAGIELLSFTTGPMLGNAEAGAVAGLAGVRTSVVSGGGLCVVGSIALALFLPRFWRYDSRTFVPDQRSEIPTAVARAEGELS